MHHLIVSGPSLFSVLLMIGGGLLGILVVCGVSVAIMMMDRSLAFIAGLALLLSGTVGVALLGLTVQGQQFNAMVHTFQTSAKATYGISLSQEAARNLLTAKGLGDPSEGETFGEDLMPMNGHLAKVDLAYVNHQFELIETGTGHELPHVA